jgi:hypothetical protein
MNVRLTFVEAVIPHVDSMILDLSAPLDRDARAAQARAHWPIGYRRRTADAGRGFPGRDAPAPPGRDRHHEAAARAHGRLPVEVEVLDRLVSEERVALVLGEAATRGEELLERRRVNLYRVTDAKIRSIEISRQTCTRSTSSSVECRDGPQPAASRSCSGGYLGPDPDGAAGVADQVEHAVGSRRTVCR